MASKNDSKRDADIAIAKLEARKEMRSAGDDEDSAVITQRAVEKVPSSAPAAAKGLVAVLNVLPPWGRVLVVVALIVGIVVASVFGADLVGWI